jgi:hypothetical protein
MQCSRLPAVARRSRRGARRQQATGSTDRPVAEATRPPVGWALAALLVLATAAAVVFALAGGGGKDTGGAGGGGPDLTHVHGLGVNPKDGSLYIATHTGLFRAANGETTPRRVGDSEQDVMGFSVLGPDRFLGSGHPGPLQSGPGNLGLIRSDDGGKNWDSVSLLGESDFHVLRSAAPMVYGYDASNSRLLVSADDGRSWQERETPGAMLDLAINPTNSSRVVASTENGLVTSDDRAGSWETLARGPLALLTWPAPNALYRVDGTGRVARSADAGRSWAGKGSIGAQPAAFASAADNLYVALPDGTVKRSDDGGETWTTRTRP